MTRAAMLAGLLVVAAAACSRRAALTSCDDNLRGVFITSPDTAPGAGPDGDERWMILDSGNTLEAYPLFPDVDGPRELEIAPRRIDLTRTGSALAGTVHRRYMRRADLCEAQLPVHVTRCAGDTLELVLADPAPPLGFAPCSWPGPAPSRLVRWQRE